MELSWKRVEHEPMYTGRRPGTMNFEYAVVGKVRSRWELWIAGDYLGKFKTLKAAKAYATSHPGVAS